MKLTYWYAECLADSSAYTVRTRTKREAVRQREEWGSERYGPVMKVEVEYDSGFDLLTMCLGEGGAHWEPYGTGPAYGEPGYCERGSG